MELEQQLNWAELVREVVDLHDFAELQGGDGVVKKSGVNLVSSRKKVKITQSNHNLKRKG